MAALATGLMPIVGRCVGVLRPITQDR